MAQAPRIFTDEEKEMMKIDMSQCELAKLLNIDQNTLRKYRKIFQILSPRSTKKGVPRHYRVINETRECINPDCSKTFVVKPAMTKKYCSHSCQQRTNNVAAKGVGSRKIRNPNRSEYKRYAGLVHGLSDITYKENIDIINPDGHPRTLCGVEGGWQLDHIITIKESFENNVPAAQVAQLENLRMLPWRENLRRNKK